MSKHIVMHNAEVRWASVNSPKDKYSKKHKGPHPSAGQEWALDVKISDEKFNKLVAKGLTKEHRESGFYKFAKNCISVNGKDMIQPPVVDRFVDPLTCNIGNGSICDIRFYVSNSDDSYALHYAGLLVRELVEYTAELEGFTLDTKEEASLDEEFKVETKSDSDDDFI